MFAYSWPGARPGSSCWNGLHYIIREPPFSTAKLLDVDYAIDFRDVTTPSDRVAVITTKPLTEEPGWVEMRRGELLMFSRGKFYSTPKSCDAVERAGEGLFSKCIKSKCNRSPKRFMASPKVASTPFSLDATINKCLARETRTLSLIPPPALASPSKAINRPTPPPQTILGSMGTASSPTVAIEAESRSASLAAV